MPATHDSRVLRKNIQTLKRQCVPLTARIMFVVIFIYILSRSLSLFPDRRARCSAQTGNSITRNAHILAEPVLADLNRDGREEELALPVSYYDELDSPR